MVRRSRAVLKREPHFGSRSSPRQLTKSITLSGACQSLVIDSIV